MSNISDKTVNINETQTVESEDEYYERMYQAYLAEQEARYDCEDAILHHYL